MGKELTSITRKTVQQVSEIQQGANKNVLKDLFEAVIEQMKRVVKAHAFVLTNVKTVLRDQTAELYSEADVWSQIQTVV